MLTTSTAGLSLIRRFEGEKLTAYPDGGGVWTIGVGHTGPDVHPGLTITSTESLRLLAQDVRDAETAVAAMLRVTVTQNQFDALVCLAFNIGAGALRSSTLMRKVNAKDFAGARDEFAKWCHDDGKLVVGLVRRRAAEAQLFGTA